MLVVAASVAVVAGAVIGAGVVIGAGMRGRSVAGPLVGMLGGVVSFDGTLTRVGVGTVGPLVCGLFLPRLAGRVLVMGGVHGQARWW